MRSKLLFSRSKEMKDILGYSPGKRVECSKCSLDDSSWVLQFMYMSDTNIGTYECMVCQTKMELIMNENVLEVLVTDVGCTLEIDTDYCCDTMSEDYCVVLDDIDPRAKCCPWCGASIRYTEEENDV